MNKEEIKKYEEVQKNEQLKKSETENAIKVDINGEYNKNIVYAGFWSRYAAFLVDIFVIGAIHASIIRIVVFILNPPHTSLDQSDMNMAVGISFFTLFLFLTIFIAYFVFATYKFQVTLGKMAVGVTVKREDGKKLSLKKIVIREVLKFIQMMFVYIPLVVVAFTQKKQGLHDLAVKSVVVCKNPEKGVNKWVVGSVIVLHTLVTLLLILSATSAVITIINSNY